MLLLRSKQLTWTHHARAKMQFYKLSEGRVRRVLQTPKRIEEGVAPKTIAVMQPASVKTTAGRPTSFRTTMRKEAVPDPDLSNKVRRGQAPAGIHTSQIRRNQKKESWSQEIWVMVQDHERGRTVISAWRYPGMTKPRSSVALQIARQEFEECQEKI